MRPNLLYVGQYTRSGKAEGILVFERDTETGRLTLLHAIAERDPSFLAFDPSRRFLLAVNELRLAQGEGNGTVASFAVDQETGNLSFLSRQSTEGGEPCHVTTDPSGSTVLVANHEDGSVAVFPLNADGRIGPHSALVRHEGSGPAPSQKGPHAHFVTFDPTEQRVLVADKGIDKVMLYRLDVAAGKLIPDEPPFFRLHPGAAPRHIAFHPNGRFAYVNGEADLTVTAFAYDAEGGLFEEIHWLSSLPRRAAVHGADPGAPERPLPVRLESRPRLDCHVCHRPGNRTAGAHRPRTDAGADATKLRDRRLGHVPVRRESEQRHHRPLPHRRGDRTARPDRRRDARRGAGLPAARMSPGVTCCRLGIQGRSPTMLSRSALPASAGSGRSVVCAPQATRGMR